MRLILLILTVGILPTIATNSDPRTCYLMNGSPAPALSPCSSSSDSDSQTTTHSPCCRLKNTTSSNKNTHPATCLSPSGLCLSSNGLMYISGCTDPTWTDPACPSICPDQRTEFKGKAREDKTWSQGQGVTHWQVMVCAPNSVCCRRFSDNSDCCGNRTLRVEGVDVGVPGFGGWENGGDQDGGMSGNVSATSTGAIATGCQSQSQSGGVGDSEGGECQACREATVGAAVGAPLGVALVATLAALAWAIRRQKVAEKRLLGVQAQASMLSSEYYKESGVRQVQKPGYHAELSAMRQYELDGRPDA